MVRLLFFIVLVNAYCRPYGECSTPDNGTTKSNATAESNKVENSSTSFTNGTKNEITESILEKTNAAPALPQPGDCDFDKDWCNWQNLIDDKFDWTRHSGRTGSSSTGPEFDVSGKGSYVYTEASWPRRPGEIARLVSPVLNGTLCMRFHYSMYGRFMGDLQIYVQDNKTMIFLWGRYKNQGSGWHSTNVTVYGTNYKVLFMGRVGKSYTSDMAIDNITFVNGTCDGLPLFSAISRQDPYMHKQEGEFGSCNFDGGFCEWINVHLEDNFDWTLQGGRTATVDTGPLVDHTTGKGKYLFIESSHPQTRGQLAQLISPRLCGAMCLQLFYHLYGSQMGEIAIYQRRGLKTDDRIWGAKGEHGDVWNEALIDISGNCYQIVIEGKIGKGYLSDAAIDDIILTKGTCCQKRYRHFDISKGYCSFDYGFCQWRNDLDRDDFDWTLLDKQTPSAETGPEGPYNSKGNYAFVESSEPHIPGDKAILVSPVLRGPVCLRFKYHMYGQHIGSLAIYRHGSGVHRRLLWIRKGNMGNLWRIATINIACGEPLFQIEFEAIINGWRSDIAIDDIQFGQQMCNKTKDAPIILETTVPTTIPLTTGDCTFPGTFCEWKNDRDDNFDWEIGSGRTPSSMTGPGKDIDGNGHFLFIEASKHLYRHKASLTSGYMKGKKCVTFYYHMFGGGIGSLSIKVISNTNYKRLVWFRSGNQGSQWMKAHARTDMKHIYKVSIIGEIGRTSQGDIAIDNISFKPGRCTYTQDTIADNVQSIHATPTIAFDDRPENCNFEKFHTCRWINVKNDEFDWKLWKGATPSRMTGPTFGHGGKGIYIYAEATSPRMFGDSARISLSRGASISCMRFYYHMYGVNMGTLNLLMINSNNIKTIWTQKGDQGGLWKGVKVTIDSSSSYKVIFEAVVGKGFQSDIALDDITFSDGPCGELSPSQRLSTTNSSSDSMQADCPSCAKKRWN